MKPFRRNIFVFFALLFPLSSFGGYGPEEDWSKFDSALLLSDGDTVVFTAAHHIYRRATGWRAFPDGGVPKYVADQQALGLFSISSGKLQVLSIRQNERFQPGDARLNAQDSCGTKVLLSYGGQLRFRSFWDSEVRYDKERFILDTSTNKISELNLPHFQRPVSNRLINARGDLLIRKLGHSQTEPSEFYLFRGSVLTPLGRATQVHGSFRGKLYFLDESSRYMAFDTKTGELAELSHAQLPHAQTGKLFDSSNADCPSNFKLRIQAWHKEIILSKITPSGSDREVLPLKLDDIWR
jgi:hypothetical protein